MPARIRAVINWAAAQNIDLILHLLRHCQIINWFAVAVKFVNVRSVKKKQLICVRPVSLNHSAAACAAALKLKLRLAVAQ
jgi:hypothetical protein